MTRNNLIVGFAIMLLILGSLACGLGQNAAETGEVPPVPTVETLTDTAVVPTPTLATATSSGDPLQDTLAGIQPDAGGNFSVVITEGEFNQTIAAAETAAVQSGQDVPIRNAAVQFTADGVVLTGDVTDPVAAPLSADLRPAVVNGRLQFTAESASLGGFPLPGSMLELVENNVNQGVSAALADLPPNVVLQDVEMSQGALTLLGQMQ